MDDLDQDRCLQINETIDLIVELKDIDSAIIIIDGLDECSNQDREREALFQGLKEIALSPGKPVKIFVASRDETDIMVAFSDHPELWVSATDNKEDIQRYVDEQLEKEMKRKADADRPISPNLRDAIQKTLVDGADGM